MTERCSRCESCDTPIRFGDKVCRLCADAPVRDIKGKRHKIHAAKQSTNGAPTVTWCMRKVVGGMHCYHLPSSSITCKVCLLAVNAAKVKP